MGICDFCNEERELIPFGKARICKLCEANQIRKPRGKEVKAGAEFTKAMPGKTHADYAKKKGGAFGLGPIE